ncbi:alpha/beta hydrolase [Microbacterium sp. 4R-513]|uniref:dienelactone hydrolase family protein n=1 Tax=Microbacterium sp. 4R-513 TaxID=2567934 RepID=UPI0013E0FA6C|nr:alpha/beta hydrolase [Microbacterium sp. 4R-513]QIG40572.1 alpha/beta hydrolase [Microbacterium sp. 4R-513]
MKHLLAAVSAIAVAVTLVIAPATLASAQPIGPTAAAPLQLAVMSATVDVSQDGRRFSALLVQPTGSAPGAYPVVAFGHGFTQSPSRYGSTLKSIASRGYVVIAPASATGLFPDHSSFAEDLWSAVMWAHRTQPNAHPTLDAVLGHSMGGGAAVLAASRHPEIETIATLAAAETRPSAVAAARAIAVPALFVVGSSDTVVKPASTRLIYDAKPSPATWVSIPGGYHCGFLDSSSFLGLGCDRGSISRATQLAISNALLGDWIDATLRGGTFAWPPTTVGERK